MGAHVIVWQLWNRHTHAIAYVVAPSKRAAQETRPDGAVWRLDQWSRLVQTGKGWTAGSHFSPAEPLPGWPDDPTAVCASKFGRCFEPFGAPEILGYHPSTDLRDPDEAHALREHG